MRKRGNGHTSFGLAWAADIVDDGDSWCVRTVRGCEVLRGPDKAWDAWDLGMGRMRGCEVTRFRGCEAAGAAAPGQFRMHIGIPACHLRPTRGRAGGPGGWLDKRASTRVSERACVRASKHACMRACIGGSRGSGCSVFKVGWQWSYDGEAGDE